MCNKNVIPEPEIESEIEVIDEDLAPSLAGKWKLMEVALGDFLTYQIYGERPPVFDYSNYSVFF